MYRRSGVLQNRTNKLKIMSHTHSFVLHISLYPYINGLNTKTVKSKWYMMKKKKRNTSIIEWSKKEWKIHHSSYLIGFMHLRW